MSPTRRTNKLIVEQLDDETLVYDAVSHQAHALDATAAAIWHACTGERSVREIAMSVDRPVVLVERTLSMLAELGLLVEGPGVTRREQLRTTAVTAAGVAMAVPLIRTILAPEAAQAATLLPNGAECSTPAQCQSGTCADGMCV